MRTRRGLPLTLTLSPREREQQSSLHFAQNAHLANPVAGFFKPAGYDFPSPWGFTTIQELRMEAMNLAIGAPVSDPARCGFDRFSTRRVGDRRSGSWKGPG